MTPIQEIHVRMANGDFADCYVEDASATFSANWEYIPANDLRLRPSRTLPVVSGTLAFESALHAVAKVAALRGTTVVTVENPCGSELVSKAAQVSVVANLGLSATVTVNGQ